MTNLTFITGNANKVAHVIKHTNATIAHHALDLDEIQSLDLHTVAEHKARQAYAALGTPVLIEDATLTFTAMGSLPGTFIKWFIQDLGIPGLAQLAHRLAHQEAIGRVCYVIYDGTDMHFFDGEMRGHIAPEPRGEGGFGFDPIFINEGFDITRGEMTEADYMATSYRTAGLDKLKEFLADV